MIGFLRGRLASAGLGEVMLDVGGVGYRVRVVPGTLMGTPGDELVVHTHLAVREDAMTLYGFADARERDLFETLLGVNGFGPKLALAAIGALGAEGLCRAVVSEDLTALTVIPGVGKKGAQRMVLDLRERLGSLASGDGFAVLGIPGGGPPGALRADPRDDVREALTGLGYGAVEVERTLGALPERNEPAELLRAALRLLATT